LSGWRGLKAGLPTSADAAGPTATAIPRKGRKTVGANPLSAPSKHRRTTMAEALEIIATTYVAGRTEPIGEMGAIAIVAMLTAAGFRILAPGQFAMGERVTKKSGSSWTGRIVGFYSTSLTPEGYAIESENEPGSVQIYPASAIRRLANPEEKP
jgi:hypothetical protein